MDYFGWFISFMVVGFPGIHCQDINIEISDDVNKAFITIAVLVVALIISIIVAKIFDYCYDHSTLRDDDSTISEDTRKKIRDRMIGVKRKKGEEAKKVIMDVKRASTVIHHLTEMVKLRRASQIAQEINTENGEAPPEQKKAPAKVTFMEENESQGTKTPREKEKTTTGVKEINGKNLTATSKKQANEVNQKARSTPYAKSITRTTTITAAKSVAGVKVKNGAKSNQSTESSQKPTAETVPLSPPKILIKQASEVNLEKLQENQTSTQNTGASDGSNLDPKSAKFPQISKSTNQKTPTPGNTDSKSAKSLSVSKPGNPATSLSTPRQTEKMQRVGQINSQSSPSKLALKRDIPEKTVAWQMNNKKPKK